MNAENRMDIRPRWGWVVLDRVRVKPEKPWQHTGDSRLLWHNEWAGGALDEAMYHAAVELPLEFAGGGADPAPVDRWLSVPRLVVGSRG